MKPHKFRLVPWLFSWKTYRLLQQKWNAYTEDPLIFINIVTLYDSIKTGCRLSALCLFLLGNFTLAFLGLLFGLWKTLLFAASMNAMASSKDSTVTSKIR